MNREPSLDSQGTTSGRVDWKGTDRYEVRRCIGAGSTGTVYEAFDVDRGRTIALKRLRHFSPATLYLFKREFRTLADFHHPNLVTFHELVATEAHDVFFTMELVRGAEFVKYVRPAGAPDFDRLRAALRQLVEGVQELHAGGKLHRDIKPSNVLVTREGRVVLLDFGVATEVSSGHEMSVPEHQPVVGTVAYMAPEQAAGETPTPASDWYSVGAILFEALVGSPLFVGSVADVLRMKSTVDSLPPSRCAENVPPDLDALCGALLQRAADMRPTGREILRWLGVSGSGQAPRLPTSRGGTSDRTRLTGGDEQLAELHRAFDVMRTGQSLTVRLRGPSGMGESTLVSDFLDDVSTHSGALVLRGRAYERESVPYKAIDSWVDALSLHLLALSDAGEELALPADIWALARLFPVLRRVPEIADVKEQVIGDPHRVRRRAFAALRELLLTLAEERPTVVYLADAHWGDADSAALLLNVLRPPHAPPFLLVMTYLEEEEQTSPFLAELRAAWPPGADARDLAVPPLGADDARRFALASLGADGEISLELSVGERLKLLPEGARLLLETIAVSGRPLPLATLALATGTDTGIDEPLELLREQRLVRVGLRNRREVVDVVHEGVGAIIVSLLSATRVRDHHGRLARALENAEDADPEAIAVHLLGAGEKDRAGPFAERAARQAVAQMAFERAIRLYWMALERADPRSPNARRLRVHLAEALVLAGRSAEAARAYLDAADGAPGVERVELERAAAEQLLISGRIDEGATVLHRVLAAIGMKAPRSTWSAVFWLIMYRLRLAVFGLRFQERKPEEVTSEDRLRIEALHAVAMGFAVVDVILGACVQARLLLLSLRAGDTLQILRAACIEATQRASTGGTPGAGERAVLAVATRLAARIGTPEAHALLDGAHGLGLFLRGRWKDARDALEGMSAKMPYGRSSLQSNGQLFGLRSLYFSGDLHELCRRHARTMADARDRGDLFTSVNLAATTMITTHLVADDPGGARRQLHEAIVQWSQTGFFVQHWQAMVFEPDIDLYSGNGAQAYDRFVRDQLALKRSLLLNVQFIRGITLYTQGRCAAASIDARPATRRDRIAETRRAGQQLQREGMPWTAPLAAMVTALAENAEGNRAAAAAQLRIAIASAEAAGMPMHAMAARYCLGGLLGGDEGRELTSTAHAAMTAQTIRNPERWVGIYLPGSWTGAPFQERHTSDQE
jgi:serine/threonine protein kinase